MKPVCKTQGVPVQDQGFEARIREKSRTTRLLAFDLTRSSTYSTNWCVN